MANLGEVVGMRWLPGGDLAVVTNDEVPRILAQGQAMKPLAGHTDIVRRVLWNPKASCLVTCSNDQAIKMWSVDGLEMASLQGHDGFVFDLLLGEGADFGNLLYSAADDRLVSLIGYFDLVTVSRC